MKWTKGLPTAPGWYAHRKPAKGFRFGSPSCQTQMVRILSEKLLREGLGLPLTGDERMGATGYGHSWLSPEVLGGEWYGPLEIPP